jgi:hypothetical protein
MAGIDLHTHAFPDDIAARAIEKLSAMGDWQAVGDGTIGGLLASMDAADLDMAVVCPIATRPGQWKGILKWARKIRKRHGERLFPLASIHPEDAKIDKAVDAVSQAELLGIKLHPFYQDFVVDGPEVRPVLQAAAEAGLYVVLHCGHDIGFENDPIPDRSGPGRLAAIIDDLPDLKLICTHMGGWQMWDEVEEKLIGKNVILETSFCQQHMPPNQLIRMIRNHGVEKVCFGTDWPWNDQQAELEQLSAAGLDPAELRQVMMTNAARIVGLYA